MAPEESSILLSSILPAFLSLEQPEGEETMDSLEAKLRVLAHQRQQMQEQCMRFVCEMEAEMQALQRQQDMGGGRALEGGDRDGFYSTRSRGASLSPISKGPAMKSIDLDCSNPTGRHRRHPRRASMSLIPSSQWERHATGLHDAGRARKSPHHNMASENEPVEQASRQRGRRPAFPTSQSECHGPAEQCTQRGSSSPFRGGLTVATWGQQQQQQQQKDEASSGRVEERCSQRSFPPLSPSFLADSMYYKAPRLSVGASVRVGGHASGQGRRRRTAEEARRLRQWQSSNTGVCALS